MTTQHVVFTQNESIALLEKIRPFVPADIWNRVLAATLIADIDSRPISVVTVDAAKANALYYLTRLSTKDGDTNYVIEQTFQSLLSLHATSM
jgi:hypothetical protein